MYVFFHKNVPCLVTNSQGIRHKKGIHIYIIDAVHINIYMYSYMYVILFILLCSYLDACIWETCIQIKIKKT